MTEQQTTCIDPSAITDADLLDFATGESEAAAAHIARCAFCREEAHAYSRLEPRMSARLFRRSCPDSLLLGQYALGSLTDAERMHVAAHLIECPHCREEAHGFSAFLAEPDPVASRTGPISAIRRLFATPISALASAAVLRGVAGGSVTYEAEHLHITLDVQPGDRPSRREIVGLIESDDEFAEAEARLLDGERLIQSEPIDEFGSFLFSSVPPSTYRVEVALPDVVVVIDPIQAE